MHEGIMHEGIIEVETVPVRRLALQWQGIDTSLLALLSIAKGYSIELTVNETGGRETIVSENILLPGDWIVVEPGKSLRVYDDETFARLFRNVALGNDLEGE